MHETPYFSKPGLPLSAGSTLCTVTLIFRRWRQFIPPQECASHAVGCRGHKIIFHRLYSTVRSCTCACLTACPLFFCLFETRIPFLGSARFSRGIGMCAARLNGGDAAGSQSDPAMETMQVGPATGGGGHGVPDVSRETDPSTSPPESIAEGACDRCREALMPFERRWKSRMCNRCFNESQGGAKCEGCEKGLWNSERKLGRRRCCKCEAYKCTECRSVLTGDEVRWVNQCCNRCYNLWKGTTKPCRSCRKGLLLPEFRGGSFYCDPCCEEWRLGDGS